MARPYVKIAVRSVRHQEDAEECLRHYQLGELGGVVRRGTWVEQRVEADEVREYDSVDDSWVELELTLEQLEELYEHVRHHYPEGRPAFRGLLLAREIPGALLGYGKTPERRLRRFRGDERLAWCVMIYDSWMD